MNRNAWLICCLAYIYGLLWANLEFTSNYETNWHYLAWSVGGIILLGLAIAVFLRDQSIAPFKLWFSAALIAIAAVVYFQLRIPQPAVNDVSNYLESNSSQVVTVAGEVLTEPRLTASQKLKFWLKTGRVENQSEVSGKLYVTLSLLQGTGIHPGQQLQIRGVLYRPQASKNPGSFDFKTYLAQQDTFAGLQGFKVVFDSSRESVWGWWKLRRRIIRSHLQGLGSPVGQLVSSMVLGRKAVDLPVDLRERFIKAGLAHILAASGFHVSLLLGIILKLTQNFTTQLQLTIGLGTLFTYIGLTGLQPSALRAGLMGAAVLIAIAMDTKVKPLGSLLLAATILLLFNPLWIADLGFQLSFLATLGLIVTLPALQTKLDWLPSAIATIVAVPIAASIWVLPLLSYVFNTVATYSIVANIICTPLIVLISLGGMISGIVALIVPFVGSAIAWLLYYPSLILIKIVSLFTNLPGSSVAVGKIPLVTLVVIYGLLILVWISKWWQKRWLLMMPLAIALILTPIFGSRLNLVQVNILVAKPEPIIVIQDRGNVVLVNSGKKSTVKYTLLPFLAAQGINHIDYAIEFHVKSSSASSWAEINRLVPIKHLVTYFPSQSLSESQITSIQLIDREIITPNSTININPAPYRLEMTIKGEKWVIAGEKNINASQISNRDPISVLLWSGNQAIAQWVNILQPQVAVAFGDGVDQNLSNKLEQQNIQLYSLQQDGAITWTPKEGIKSIEDY